MALAVPGGPESASGETFLDLGSNAGMCSYLMLSKGYRAVIIEEDAKYWPWIRSTVIANEGWSDRTQMHHKLVGEPVKVERGSRRPVPLDRLLPSPSSVRLWKLDVDGTEVAVLKSFKEALAAGRVDVVQFELVNEEVRANKLPIFELLESFGFELFAAFAPDRQGGFNDGHEGLHRYCAPLWSRINEFRLVDVSNAWTALPDVRQAVLPAADAAKYHYGSQRAGHFEFVPFCNAPTRRLVGPGLCWMQYVAVLRGSHASRQPAFSREGVDCSKGGTDSQAFIASVGRRLQAAVDAGLAWSGPEVAPIFPDPRKGRPRRRRRAGARRAGARRKGKAPADEL